MFEQLKEILSEMPNLEKEINRFCDQSYKVTSIFVNSTHEQNFISDRIGVIMGDPSDNRVYIESFKFYSEKADRVSVNKIATANNMIHPELKLDGLTIHNKEFKKSLFRGYDETEVDSFLDIIVSDYEFFRKYILDNRA